MKWTTINSKNINGFTFVPVTFPMNRPDSILIENLKLQQLIEYIRKKNIKKAFILEMSNFEFLRNCPSLEHIAIELNLPFNEYATAIKRGNRILKKYDFEPIFNLLHLKSLTVINNERPGVNAEVQFDISKMKEIMMYEGEYSYVTNINEAVSLKTLILKKYGGSDLINLNQLVNLDTLGINFSKLNDLSGISAFNCLQCLYLHYNRSLSNISALSKVKGTLKALRIENCPKIEDFSVLGELESLELLELSGSNTLPNLEFLKTMKQLKTFIFNMNVLDGDLSLCMNLSYVYSEKNRRHYNLKDSDLPQGKFIRGNEDIEEWRRLE